MTVVKVSDSTSILQPDSALPPPLGRRAFGRQRRMSQATIARNIVDSIRTHRDLGQDRQPSFYTTDPDLQALVQAQLNAD